ncbi:hypothetical protein [Novosphingobium sp. 9U]|uniref:hypothetical protein n=1 Tax=Novosphingobium sp. 9U TaxID=2653158 RepID=UPI00135CDE88|nr:hypothetical protein [Novosphingobium sp. 9U]
MTCVLLTGAYAAAVPTAAQAETGATTRFADMALITQWSLPRVGPLHEPTIIAPPSAAVEPAQRGPVSKEIAAEAPKVAPAGQALGPQLAEEDLTARGFTRSDRLQSYRVPADIKGLEIAFHLLNAADAISTVACLKREDCQEQNPIYGKRPKAAMVIGAKALTSGVHYWVMRTLLPEHPGMARAFGWFAVTVQGSVVGLNMSQLF